MTDHELRAELRSIMAVPVLDRYARKTVGVSTIARRSKLARLTVYRVAWGDETVSRKSKDMMKAALTAGQRDEP